MKPVLSPGPFRNKFMGIGYGQRGERSIVVESIAEAKRPAVRNCTTCGLGNWC